MSKPTTDVTILLTLRDRVAFTHRWLSYAQAVRLPFHVLVADGGADTSLAGVFADRSRFADLSIDYVRYPYDTDYQSYFAKIVDALARVTTEYVVMADNDDFLIADTIAASAQFLHTNPGFSSCGGQSAMFWVSQSSRATDSGVYGERVDWKRTSEIPSIIATSACDRIRKATQSAGDPAYYDVKRTRLLREHFTFARDMKFHDLFLVENLLWYLNVIRGKTMRMPTLQLARQQNAPESSAEVHASRFGDWFGRMLVPTWSADFQNFIAATSAALAEADGISLDEARAFMVTAYRADVAPPLLRNLLTEPSVRGFMPVVMQTVARLVALPQNSLLRRAARAVYRRSEWMSPEFAFYGIDFVARRSTPASEGRDRIVEFLTRGS